MPHIRIQRFTTGHCQEHRTHDQKGFALIIDKKFNKNLKSVFNNEQLNHTFSISIRYFIDYNHAKNVFKSKV
jgi:hypothetical protein